MPACLDPASSAGGGVDRCRPRGRMCPVPAQRRCCRAGACGCREHCGVHRLACIRCRRSGRTAGGPWQLESPDQFQDEIAALDADRRPAQRIGAACNSWPARSAEPPAFWCGQCQVQLPADLRQIFVCSACPMLWPLQAFTSRCWRVALALSRRWKAVLRLILLGAMLLFLVLAGPSHRCGLC